MIITASRPVPYSEWRYPSLWRGCVGAWCPSQDGPTGDKLQDRSRFRNHGTLTNMTLSSDWVNIDGGYSLKVDTTYPNYVNLGRLANFHTLNKFTICWWMRPASVGGSYLGKWSSDNDPITDKKVLVRTSGDTLQLYVRNSADTAESSPALGGANALNPTGIWKFCIVEADGSAIRAGVNHSYGSDVSFSAPYIPDSSGNWGIGRAQGASCDAYFDDIRFYNRLLTAREKQILIAGGRGIAYERQVRWPVYEQVAAAPTTTSIVSYAIPKQTVGYPRWKYPSLWRGCVGAWCPSISGPTGTVLRDYSGYRNNGTLTSMDAATDWVISGGKGGSGYALDFDDDNDEVLISKSGLVHSFITVSVWAKSVGLRNDTQGIVTLDGGSGDAYRIYLKDDGTDKAGFTCWIDGAFRTAEWTNAVEIGWYHLCGTYDGSNVRLYVDGILRATTAYSGVIADPGFGSYLVLGSTDEAGAANKHWDGFLDDTRIYNRALSPDEIATLALRRGVAFEREARWPVSQQAAVAATLKNLALLGVGV